MVQLVLSDEQAETLCRAGGTVQVVDRSGRDLGRLVPAISMSNETAKCVDPEVAVALQRMEHAKQGGTFYTTSEVLEHLHLPE
jgi:hypothetical protein